MDNNLNAPFPEINEVEFLARARKLVAADNEVQALKLVQQVLRVNSNNPTALLLYGQLSTDIERAIKALKRLLTIEPESAEARIQLKRLQRDLAATAPEKPKNDRIKKSDNDEVVQQLKQQNQLLMAQMQRQPVINIVNSNNSSAVAQVASNPTGQNSTAFWIGFIAATCGFYGVAHIFSGKLFTGLAWLLIGGPVFLILMWSIGLATGVGIFCAIPLHFVAAWQHAKQGARAT
jgi:hypothetical protein